MTDMETLTPAQRRVLRCLPTHLTIGQIAGELLISHNTAKTHVSAIYAKLGVHSRTEAVTKLEAERQRYTITVSDEGA